MTEMLAQWGAIEAFLLPIVIAFIVGENWPESVKAVTAFVVCLVVSAITYYLTSGLGAGILPFMLAVTVAAIALFKLSYQKMGLTGRTGSK